MKLFISILVLFFSFSFAKTALASSGLNEESEKIIKLVEKFYPKARLVTKNDHGLARNCGSALDHPGFVIADFIGNGKVDYAVLLSGLGPLNSIVLFLNKNDGEFSSEVLEKEAGDVIELVNKGERLDADEDLLGKQEGNHVVLKCAAIQSEFCEKSSFVLYWDSKKKKFLKVWTGD